MTLLPLFSVAGFGLMAIAAAFVALVTRTTTVAVIAAGLVLPPAAGLSAADQALGATVIEQIGQQIENIRLLEETNQYRAEAEAAVRRLAGEGWLSGQHLVEHAAEGPDVGAPVDLASPRLLGAHVAGGAKDHPGHYLLVPLEALGLPLKPR